MIQTKCASCGKAYQLPDEAAGKKAKCKACGAVMAIPASAADDPLGLGGGAVGLAVVVIVAVVLMGGSDADKKKVDSTPGGLALSGGTVPSNASTTNPFGTTPTDVTDVDEEAEFLQELAVRFDADVIKLPEDKELSAWTAPVQSPTDEASVKLVAYRGLDFQVPAKWEVSYSKGKDVFEAEMEDGVPRRVRELYEQTSVLNFVPAEATKVSVRVAPRPTKQNWPPLYWVEETRGEMVLGTEIAEYAETNEPESGLPNATFIERLRSILNDDPQAAERPVGFAWAEPEAFFVNRKKIKDVTFGEMFAGYRFARLSGADLGDDTAGVTYVGYVGDLLVTLQIQYPKDKPASLDEVERVIRSARLLSESDAEELTQEDTAYQKWLRESKLKLAFLKSTAPISDGVAVVDVTNDPRAPLPAGVVAPLGKGYGLIVPASMKIVSNTRTAVRTQPLDDGSWLTMEVHKLTGWDRRQDSPIDTAKGTILLRGFSVPIPENAELSEITSPNFTIQRLLYPELPGTGLREVAYVIKDGPHLVTLIGRFPLAQPERLAEFDEAAKTVQKMPEQEPEESE